MTVVGTSVHEDPEHYHPHLVRVTFDRPLVAYDPPNNRTLVLTADEAKELRDRLNRLGPSVVAFRRRQREDRE